VRVCPEFVLRARTADVTPHTISAYDRLLNHRPPTTPYRPPTDQPDQSSLGLNTTVHSPPSSSPSNQVPPRSRSSPPARLLSVENISSSVPSSRAG
jgi:hypothetical protein